MEVGDKITLAHDISILGSNFYLKKGTEVTASKINKRERYYGKMSGVLYPEKILSIKITECDYPISWMPTCFK